MTVFRFRVTDENPAHVRADLFCGPDPDHLALSGHLTFRVDEWPAFADAITQWNERQEQCGSCGGTAGPPLVQHRRGCQRCPRCGGTDDPIGRWDVCQPCAGAEGWDEADQEVEVTR